MKLEGLLRKRDTIKSWRLGSHILFWILYFCVSVYLFKISFHPYRDLPLSYLEPLRRTMILIVVYYPLVYWVGARLLKKSAWGLGVVVAFALFLLYALLDYAGEMLTLKYCEECAEGVGRITPDYYTYLQRGAQNVLFSRIISLGLLFQFLFSVMIPLAIKIALGYHRYYIRNLELAKENVQLELNFLKAQVNPHFLFNTLNNLYSLVLHEKKEKSVETVARLSDFMRYALYETGEKQISLEKEVDLIKNYIVLEQLRLNHTKVIFTFTSDKKSYSVPPLLFMPVVENAFKYNVDYKNGSTIDIRLDVQKGILKFTTENSYDPNRSAARNGGIGLVNLKKRLSHYFPDRSTYEAYATASRYSAHLTLHLI